MSQPWIVMMPDNFDNARTRHACDTCPNICGGKCQANPFFCPLANAKKAVEVKQPRYNGERVWSLPCSPVTLYAVEDEK